MEMPPGPPVTGPPGPPDPGPAPPDPWMPTDDDRARRLADEAANRRMVATLAAVALVAVAFMIGAFLLTRGSGDDAQAVAPETSTPLEVPAATSVPAGEPLDAADLDALLPELQAFVEDERGLDFTEDIDLEVLGSEAYAARAESDFEEDLADTREDLESSAAAMQAIGLWPAGTDPVEVVSELAAAGSLGFYDPETGEMVVRGSSDTPNLRITLVHELTHALEDQHFELDRPELDDAFDESGLAFSALVEGSANRVETAYTATLTDDEVESAVAEQEDLVAGVDVNAFPPILLAQQDFVYTKGAAFVEAVADAGGNPALDQALERPPTTSEQILEPDDWPEREEIVDVPVPEADQEALDEGVVGQFLLHTLTGIDAGVEPTPEWDGDSSVVWRDGDEACLRMAISGDLDTFEDSLTPWADQVGAELSQDGDLLVATSCR